MLLLWLPFCLIVLGCPTALLPLLDIAPPHAITFGTNGTENSITIRNGGGGTLEWTAFEVRRVNPFAVAFTGTGPNDLTVSGVFTGATDRRFTITIDSVGEGLGGADTFSWRVDSGPIVSGVSITGSLQFLQEGVSIGFNSATGHTLGDQWVIDVTTRMWEPFDAAFLSLAFEDGTPANGAVTGTTQTETDRVRVRVNRDGLPPGSVSGFGVQIDSNGGSMVIPISLTVVPSLSVSPTLINIPPNSNSATFTINNSGPQTLNYTIVFLEDPTDPTSVIPTPEFVVEFASSGSVPPNGSRSVVLVIDREGLPEGAFSLFLLIQSNSGEGSVRINFGVGGAGVFDVTPDVITLSVNIFGSTVNPTATFSFNNPDTESHSWTLEFEDPDIPGLPVALPPFISIEPRTASLGGGRTQVVTVEVDPTRVTDASLTQLNIFVNLDGIGRQPVRLQVISFRGPRLSIQQEPPFRTNGFLDFGTTENVLTLGIGNTGGVGTVLEFELATDRPDLILLPVPSGGRSIGFDCPFITDFLVCYDWRPFNIVINRRAMSPGADIDGGQITITPVSNPELAPITVAVSVTRAPLRIEGALNRARPPFVQRFIFLLRDSFLESIDTTNPDIRRNISLSIEENDLPLDLNETNSFVAGPEGLKMNIVLLLDFSGSMFRAGQNRGVPNGAAIAEMKQAAAGFVRELLTALPTARISVMEHHERDQRQRVLHPFTTNADDLAASIENFNLQPAQHGESEVFDALIDAAQRLVDQDPGIIPFDDADVRAIVHVTDGNDTSSEFPVGQVTSLAVENRVRVYPVIFGDFLNLAPLVDLADDSGGHDFKIIEPFRLSDVLGTAVTGDAPGMLVEDLTRQLVLTYISLLGASGSYRIVADFIDDLGNTITGSFQKDALFLPGDARAGQISLVTDGIQGGRAVVDVRTDYVPRNINQFRFRFIFDPPEFAANLEGLPQILTSPTDNGLLFGWRLVEEGDGVYTLVTQEDNPLPFGAFGNLLRLNFSGLGINDQFQIGFRVDNTLYARTDPTSTVNTKFFQYPGGPTNPGRRLLVARNARDIAGPAPSLPVLQDTSFEPDAPNAFDTDRDGVPDFDDIAITNTQLPGSITSVSFVVFPDGVAGTNMGTFTITNNRLNTMNWTISESAENPLSFDADFSNTFGTLAPGESIDITITISRAGLNPGTYRGDIVIDTDVTVAPAIVSLIVEVF